MNDIVKKFENISSLNNNTWQEKIPDLSFLLWHKMIEVQKAVDSPQVEQPLPYTTIAQSATRFFYNRLN